MFSEVQDLDVSLLGGCIAKDEGFSVQPIQNHIDVDAVSVREGLSLDAKGPIFEPSFTIGEQPKPLKSEALGLVGVVEQTKTQWQRLR